MKQTTRKLWAWLGSNKDQIEAISTVLQVLTVIVGVGVGINEFVIKDRQGQRERRKNTLDLVRASREFQDLELTTLAGFEVMEVEPGTGEITARGWESIRLTFERLRPLAEDFYARLELGIRYDELDEDMCIDYFGLRALRTARMYHYLYLQPLKSEGASGIVPFFHFAARVLVSKNEPIEEEEWIMQYVKRHPGSTLSKRKEGQ